MKFPFAALALGVAILSQPASAGEVYGGVYAHAVDTPFTLSTQESGVDLQVGFRTGPIDELAFIGRPSPYIFASINSEEGGTDFAGVGLSWKIDLGPVYLRPGAGLVLHNAPELRVNPETRTRTDLGSRVLFEPEIAIGAQLSDRFSLEASWVHISNARLFDSQQNPGIDMIGMRLNYAL